MDIKCRTNPFYFSTSPHNQAISFQGGQNATRIVERASKGINAEKIVGLCEDKFVRRPVASKSATGLLGFVTKCKNAVVDYAKNYVKNIKHTYDHKIVFALVEKELFGRNSIDSLTHDLDKLVMYTLGLPKSIVSKIHRKISVHHTESGKKMNLRSMLCDNIASSPEFKPEKTKSLREHYATCPELQKVSGFDNILKAHNYGEDLDFNAIKAEKDTKFQGYAGFAAAALNILTFFYANAKSSSL